MKPDPKEYIIEALAPNMSGQLSSTQKAVLHSMMKARNVTAWLLIVLGLFMALPTLGAWLLGGIENNNEALILGGFGIVTLLIVFYGFKIRSSNKKAGVNIENKRIKSITGTATKIDARAPARAPIPGGGSVLVFIPVKAGIVKIDDKGSFGVLPGPLYGMILDKQKATFYYLEIGGMGFKKNLIVNFLLDE